eukprot:2767883-Amphidinium_carterae.3
MCANFGPKKQQGMGMALLKRLALAASNPARWTAALPTKLSLWNNSGLAPHLLQKCGLTRTHCCKISSRSKQPMQSQPLAPVARPLVLIPERRALL